MSMMTSTVESSLFLFSINNLQWTVCIFFKQRKISHMAIITEPWGDNCT